MCIGCLPFLLYSVPGNCRHKLLMVAELSRYDFHIALLGKRHTRGKQSIQLSPSLQKMFGKISNFENGKIKVVQTKGPRLAAVGSTGMMLCKQGRGGHGLVQMELGKIIRAGLFYPPGNLCFDPEVDAGGQPGSCPEPSSPFLLPESPRKGVPERC